MELREQIQNEFEYWCGTKCISGYHCRMIDTDCNRCKQDWLWDKVIELQSQLNSANEKIKEREWINYMNKQPEYDNYYLVAIFNQIHIRYFDGKYFDDNNITHWMPLPEPPK